MTSSMREPRSVLADCSPSTHEMASAMFDLPQPFGPIIAATPSPGNFSSVRSQKDLNPRIWSFFSLSNFDSFGAPSCGHQARTTGQTFSAWADALAGCADWWRRRHDFWLVGRAARPLFTNQMPLADART